jgi:hypothetical protein
MRLFGKKCDYLGKNVITWEKIRLLGKKYDCLRKNAIIWEKKTRLLEKNAIILEK